jgi:hypothetical protein
MGWFSSGTKDDSGPAKTAGGAFESPSRSNRKQCYAARDAFFECLDKNNVLDSINTKSGREKAQTFCGQLDQEFEKNCAHSWVGQIVMVAGWHHCDACEPAHLRTVFERCKSEDAFRPHRLLGSMRYMVDQPRIVYKLTECRSSTSKSNGSLTTSGSRRSKG